MLVTRSSSHSIALRSCLQGPTVSNVFNRGEQGSAVHHVYAATICVTKKRLYGAVKALQKVSAV